jgi:Fe2+ transport system protein B
MVDHERAAEKQARIAEQQTRAAEQQTRLSEQQTRTAEQQTRTSEQEVRESEQQPLLDQIWTFLLKIVLIMLLMFIPVIGVGTVIIGRNIYVYKTLEHKIMLEKLDSLSKQLQLKTNDNNK